MPQPSAVTDEQRAEVARLHAEGKGRNEIAKLVGLSAGSITAIAKKAGLNFDRAATATATEARRIDNKARRIALSERLLDEANQILDKLHQPFKAFAFGGRDNTYAEHLLDGPPTGDIRNLVQAAASAIGRHIDLEKVDAETGAEDAKSMLTELGRALGIRSPDEPA